MWCDDDGIKPYFVSLGKEPTYSNLHRQMMDSLVDEPFPRLNSVKEENCFFLFGSVEEHYKYRKSVMAAYPDAHYPVFKGYNHMEYQIRDPGGFAEMLVSIIRDSKMPDLAFLERESK